MKLEDITTIEQAKAMAFDCIQAIEMQQQNLRALQQRIVSDICAMMYLLDYACY